MSYANFLPLVVSLLLVTPVALARVHPPTDRTLTRVAIYLFGRYVDEFRSEHPARRHALRAAHAPDTYREYGARTFTFATLGAVLGSVLGIYLIWGILAILSIEPDVLRESLPSLLTFLANFGGVPELDPRELFVLFLVSSLTLGVIAGGATYWLRWWYPSYVADRRARAIEASLPSTVAFCYALSRSGMEFPQAIRIVGRNGDTYGTAAAEFDVAVKNMDVFGTDVTAALQTMGRRTASPQFREFTENLVSVLQSGHSLSDFLERQYHEYREEAESQQESILRMLATLAEAYVTVLVAGPLFLITILVVIGFSMGETIEPLRALIYVILPFGNLAFMVYLSMLTDRISPGGGSAPTERFGRRPTPPMTDGGVATSATASTDRARANLSRLRVYRKLRSIRRILGRPRRTLLERPSRLLWVTVPLAGAVVATRLPAAVTDGLGAVDDVAVIAALFVTGTFAVVYEIHRHRIEAVEAAVPDLLDRLASLNEAGMPIVSSVDRIRRSDLGVLNPELDRLWGDVRWGSDLEAAFRRFDRRIRTRAVSRMVTLLTEAMNASGNLATVLRIASRQAAADRRLARERKQTMTEYMVVVYVSFLVFVFIVAVLTAYLLPNMPAETATSANGDGPLADLGGGDRETYSMLFYHAAVIQGATSGFVAGQLATGDVRAGAKHAAFMMLIALVLFGVVL
ncbi:type II secretion system F family protein [Halovivax gelatinilyticus]|uniref:type II secretion system F family protein n=1 Tax=Halovivax gelatinilyticus TaxID=2961597 RepID=UPI0020CA587D|nr:type II secretion system F family protein [Halovivax gelatinilyticus]